MDSRVIRCGFVDIDFQKLRRFVNVFHVLTILFLSNGKSVNQQKNRIQFRETNVLQLTVTIHKSRVVFTFAYKVRHVEKKPITCLSIWIHDIFDLTRML